MLRASGAVVVAVAALALASSALAITVTTSPTTATTSVTLNGNDQVGTFTETLTITAQLSTGWNVTAYAAAPVGANGTLSPLTVTQLPTASCSGGGCTTAVPDSSITGLSWPVTLGTTSATATKIFNAQANTGDKHTQLVTVVFGTPVAANELAGSYTTTLNVLVANGP